MQKHFQDETVYKTRLDSKSAHVLQLYVQKA